MIKVIKKKAGKMDDKYQEPSKSLSALSLE